MEISNNFLATNEKKFHNSPIFFCFWRFQKKTKQNLNDFYSIPARIPIRQIRRNRRNFQHFGYFFSSLGHFLLQKKVWKNFKKFSKNDENFYLFVLDWPNIPSGSIPNRHRSCSKCPFPLEPVFSAWFHAFGAFFAEIVDPRTTTKSANRQRTGTKSHWKNFLITLKFQESGDRGEEERGGKR